MALNSFPTSLQPSIQTGYLEHMFGQALHSKLAFRNIATRESFPNRIGETITKSRHGLKAPRLTPISGASNTNLDNGLTPAAWAVEQYTLSIAMYGDTIDLNTVTEKVGIANQFIVNAQVNGTQAAQTLDRLARNALYSAAAAGNTRVATASSSTTVPVDDISGFAVSYANGVPGAVSAGNPLSVVIGAGVYSVVGTTISGLSTNPYGTAGNLTLASAVSVGDGALGNTVTSAVASSVLRPNGRTNTGALVAGDLLTMSLVLDAVAVLRKNNVPVFDDSGTYAMFVDPVSARQLFADSDFRQLFQGATNSNSTYKSGIVNHLVGVTFYPTTETSVQPFGALNIRRPILVGQGALIEGDMANMSDHDGAPVESEISTVDGVVMITRPPLDRLSQIIAQSWYWIGGFCVPSDTTVNTSIVPTSTNAAYKRAVLVEHSS